MTPDWIRWLTVVKQRIEDLSSGNITLSASQITTGVFDPARIPDLPFTRIQLTARHLLGRTTAGLGDAEEITVTGGLTLVNGLLKLTMPLPTAPIVTGASLTVIDADDGLREAQWAMAATSAPAVAVVRGPQGASGSDGRDAEDSDDRWAMAATFPREAGPFTAGSIVFAGPSGVLAQDNSNVFYDSANRRIGVRTAVPLQALQVGALGDITSNAMRVTVDGGTAAANPVYSFFRAGVSDGFITYTTSGGTIKMLFGNDPAGYTAAALLAASSVAFDLSNGRFGVGTTSPTAVMHIKAGTATANTAPLKFTSGTLLTTAEAGAVEFLTDAYYGTITTGAARKTFAFLESPAFTTPNIGAATGASLALTGALGTYQNVATAGWGVSAIYGSGRSTAQTAAVASVAAYTCGASDGTFRVSANVNVTTSTAHNFTVQVTYTDETNTAQTLTLPVIQLAGTIITAITNVTGAGPYEGVPALIRVKASTAITVKTAGTFTTVTYNVSGLIEQDA